jgi:glycosyltransferase involved in cell wall biosynthesis
MYQRNICRKIYRIIDNLLSEKIIAVAESAKQELVFKGVSPSKITVIINGSLPLAEASEAQKSLTRRRLNISDNDFIVGIVARLEEYKGHKTFIEAAVASKKDGENIKFLIIGDGSIKKELVKYAKSLDVTDRVIFTGFVENVSELVNILDLNVNCSTGTETSCLAISEGASIGIPAVVSDYGGNPNMVLNGKTGYIYPQKNANELYKIIKSLKNSPKMIEKMKFNIKNDYIQRFSAIQMAKSYEVFYINLNKERILSKKRSKTR